jgi:hypothetical protein
MNNNLSGCPTMSLILKKATDHLLWDVSDGDRPALDQSKMKEKMS